MRTKDSEFVAEEIRVQPNHNAMDRPLWVRHARGTRSIGEGGTWVTYTTPFEESLQIEYGPKGSIIRAEYRHWNDGAEVQQVIITGKGKRQRVLETIRGEAAW